MGTESVRIKVASLGMDVPGCREEGPGFGFELPVFRMQGYLARKKTPLPRTLQEAYS